MIGLDDQRKRGRHPDEILAAGNTRQVIGDAFERVGRELGAPPQEGFRNHLLRPVEPRFGIGIEQGNPASCEVWSFFFRA